MVKDENKSSLTAQLSGRSPIRDRLLVFVGFLLLGAALALLLFGGDLLGNDTVENIETGQTGPGVLDQVWQIPALSADEALAPPAVGPDGPLSAGDRAYDFTVNDLEGNPVSLADYRNRPVVVNFWATWCAPCRLEMPALQDAYEKYQEEGLVILALDQDEPADVARAFFYDEMGLTFSSLLDEGSKVSASYGSYGVLPSTYFIDADGIVTAIHRGPLTTSQLEGYLSSILVQRG